MKAKKVVKRLAKIEALISDLTDRCSTSAVKIREALQDAKAAFTRVKNAVNSQSSEKAKRARTRPKKSAVKKAAVKTATARTAKKSAPIKKAVKKAVARRKAPAAVPVQTPTTHVA